MATTAASSVATSARRKGGKRPTEIANGPMPETVSSKKVKISEVVSAKVRMKKEPESMVLIKHIKQEKVDEISDQQDKENLRARQVLAFDWTAEELSQLINNLTACLPRNDNVKYSTLIDKLDWEKVRFGTYTAAQCRDKWMQIMTRLRRFRTLTDMITDAKEWIKHPWATNSSKKQKHPDLPKKPLTPYFRYFLEKREKYSREHPDMSMTDLAKLLSKKFQQMAEKKKLKYKESYEKENEIYKKKLEKFKKEHPEEFPNPDGLRHPPDGPGKPQTAFQLFLFDRLKKSEYCAMDRKESTDKIRKLWNGLSDSKRIKWIRKAQQEHQKYTNELEKYCQEHPFYKPDAVKGVLSKAEKGLVDRYDGKPERPPNSGYSLFSRIMLRELKDVPSKEKMGEISKRWRLLTETERESYNKQAQRANAKYKEKYAAYLSSLSEEERIKLENETKNTSKRKITIDTTTNGSENKDACDSKDKLKKIIEENKQTEVASNAIVKKEPHETVTLTASGGRKHLYKGEPRKPPQSGYGVFSSEMLSLLTEVDPKNRMAEIAKRWKAMSLADKEKYKKKAQDLMKKYVKDFQKFQASLTPAEVQEYQRLKERTKKGGTNAKVLPAKVSKPPTAVKQSKSKKKESESESSDDDDDDDDSSDGDEEGSGKSGNESGSGSGSDESGSGSGSDESGSDDSDDDDDDDDDDDEDNQQKDGAGNDSSSGDSDSDSDSASASESGSSSDDSSDSGSESEEEGG